MLVFFSRFPAPAPETAFPTSLPTSPAPTSPGRFAAAKAAAGHASCAVRSSRRDRAFCPASVSRQGTGVTVQLHLHAASIQTSYLGLMETPFVDGVREREISLTVPRGSQPVSPLLSGRVVEAPGTYTLSIALDATETGADAPIRITQQAPRVVETCYVLQVLGATVLDVPRAECCVLVPRAPSPRMPGARGT